VVSCRDHCEENREGTLIVYLEPTLSLTDPRRQGVWGMRGVGPNDEFKVASLSAVPKYKSKYDPLPLTLVSKRDVPMRD
jgi:hypothetical protein